MTSENEKDEQRLYHDLAWVWPIISPPEDYIEEAELIAKSILKASKIPVKTLLNLGCGGGHEDYTLKKYFTITGVDVSENMLEIARNLNPENTYCQGDWKTVSLNKLFDSVIATSLIYVKSEEELRITFLNVIKHLKPGGVFITFAEKLKGSFQQNDTICSTHKKDDVEITFLENYYDPDPSGTILEATFIYLIRRNGKLDVQKDSHLCGIFPLDTWLEILKEVGFDVETKIVKLSVATVKESFPMLVCTKPL
ncbi:MAG: class I SAM-dependent methyltransferase [Thermoplasmata archaeon]|nr:MAG: class I SAM-dependent methyltransferase [Thermoplasmata archaeon]